MTRVFSLLLFVIAATFSPVYAASRISLAIMPIETTTDIAAGDKQAAEDSLHEGLLRSGKFSVVERSQIEKILKEQAFSLTGATQKAIEVGKLLRVDKIVTANLYKQNNVPAISISVIDIQTGQIELKTESVKHSRWQDLARVMTARISQKYQVIGEISAVLNAEYIVDLGTNDGLQPGTRLFAARKTVTRGDKGEILFEEMMRLGTLQVTSVDNSRSKARLATLDDRTITISKGDSVSPEPLPQKPVRISQTPLLSHITKGKLLLDDDMSRNRYLTAENSARDTYASGELHLDATKTKMKHAYAIYPPPFDKLTNFILEGEIKFAKNGNKSNRAEIAFRANKPYFHSDGYILYINNDGGYRVDIRRDGAGFPVAEFSSSPILNRGVTAENTFKIVAYGSLFDIYINDKLLLGFEHEMFDRGTIWLLVLKGGYATFDNIKVWEATLK